MERLRAALADRSAIVFDIREPVEHATGVAAGARPVPLSELKQRLDLIPRDQPVLLVCNTQNRSAALTATLRERGWTQVQYVEGGMSEWVRRGWSTVPPAAAAAAASSASASGR